MHGAYERTWSSDTQNVISGMASGLNLDRIAFNLRYSSDKVPRSNPWTRTLENGDFILIAEFAENEGPKPVMTIPKNAGENFDVNAFALHVMSVDYTQSRGNNFSIVEDTQLFLTERKEGIYAYVHHFTLYDIHARGFVRPYCMCYISHSKRKMFSFLDSFMNEFTKVSQLFRHGNRITFLRDLEERLSDILLLKEKSILENSSSSSLVGKKWKVTQVAGKSKKNMNVEYELILTETKKLIEVLEPHLKNDPRVEHQLKRLEDLVDGQTYSFTDADGFCMVKHKLSDHKLPRTQKPTLRKAISLPDVKDLLKGYKELNLKPRSCLPTYLNTMKQLRHLHDLCEWGAKEGLNRLRCVFKHYSKETVALLIEKTETSHLDRFPSLLTIGRSVVCNVLRNIDVKCVNSRRTSRSSIDLPSQECLTRKSSCGSLESMHSLESFQSCVEEEFLGSSKSSDGPLSPFSPSCSFHADLQGGERNEFLGYSTSESLRSDGRDAMSTHSDTTLTRATAETVSLSDFALTDEESSSNLSGSPFSRITSVTPETNIGMHFSQFRGKSLSLESLSTSSDSKGHHVRHRKKLDVSVLQVQNSFPPKTERVPIVSTPDVSSRNASTKSNLFGKNSIRRVKSLDTPRTSSCIGEEKLLQRRSRYNARPEMVRLRCFAEEVSQPLASYTGSNLLLLRNHLSFGIHLLYALLCGRPVVVFAEPRNERDARIVVSALWMFVPENMSHGKVVDPWRTKPLQIADLAWLKLVGLAKSKHFNMIPKSVKRFVSVLDLETDRIVTPQYKGCYIRPMCSTNNMWPSNAALVAFVHSVFLELANKAYVYYFASCLGGLQWCYCKSDQQSQSGQAIVDVDGSEVLSRLRVHFSDAKIVQYFSELIKQQQIDYFDNLSADQDFVGDGTLSPESDSASERRSLLICTDPSKCVVFHNVNSQESTRTSNSS